MNIKKRYFISKILFILGYFIPLPFLNKSTLGIMPYISASILTQLMCYMFLFFYKQDCEIGIKKIVLVIIALLPSISLGVIFLSFLEGLQY